MAGGEVKAVSLETPDQICRESLCRTRLWGPGDKLLADRGYVTMFHPCVPLQRAEGRGKEKHTLNRSSEGQAMIPTPLVTAPDSSLYQLNPKHQQYQYYSPHSEKEDTEAQRGSHRARCVPC